VTVTATNVVRAVTQSLVVSVAPAAVAPTITSVATASGTVGQAFSHSLTASGTAPITWTASGLPAGLNLSGATITGTPTTAGSATVTVTARNGAGSATQALALTVRSATAAFSARINFQPIPAPAVAGWTVDGGEPYAARNALTYGWNVTVTGAARDRNAANSPDQRYDTLVHSQKGVDARWELAVPNGIYRCPMAPTGCASSPVMRRTSTRCSVSLLKGNWW